MCRDEHTSENDVTKTKTEYKHVCNSLQAMYSEYEIAYKTICKDANETSSYQERYYGKWFIHESIDGGCLVLLGNGVLDTGAVVVAVLVDGRVDKHPVLCK